MLQRSLRTEVQSHPNRAGSVAVSLSETVF